MPLETQYICDAMKSTPGPCTVGEPHLRPDECKRSLEPCRERGVETIGDKRYCAKHANKLLGIK